MQTWMPAIHAGMTIERKIMKHFVVSCVYARDFAQAARKTLSIVVQKSQKISY